MKKILIVLLIALIMPSVCFLSACKKERYNLSTLETQYLNIAEGKHFVMNKDKHLSIVLPKDYSLAISQQETFSNIVSYNKVFFDLMDFSNTYIAYCSNSQIVVSKQEYNDINNSLNLFASSLTELDNNLYSLSQIGVDIDSASSVQELKNVLNSYNSLLEKAMYFSNNISTLYFEKVLITANINLSEIKEEQLDVKLVLSKLGARLKYQKSNLAQVYCETNLIGESVVNDVINKTKNIDLTKYNADVEKIDKTFSTSANVNDKTIFYSLCVKAYNLQEILIDDSERFIYACKKIRYADKPTAVGSNEIINKEIIDNYASVVANYNAVLASMLEQIGA